MAARGTLVIALGLVVIGGTQAQNSIADRADHVFLINIDGCAPRYLEQLDVQNLRALTEVGAWTLRAVTVEPSLTLPANASMVSSRPVGMHDMDWDEWAPERGPLRVSSIFTETRRAGLKCAGFVGPRKLEHLAPTNVFEIFECYGQGDEAIMDAAIAHLSDPQERVQLYYIQLPDLETAGLHHGWGSQQYCATLLNADHQIGRLLTAINRSGLSTKSSMIVTSDHGGEGMRHDVTVDTVMKVPWIAAGVGIRQGYPIPDDLTIMDTGPAVLRLFGIPVPADWEGRIPDRVLSPR